MCTKTKFNIDSKVGPSLQSVHCEYRRKFLCSVEALVNLFSTAILNEGMLKVCTNIFKLLQFDLGVVKKSNSHY